MSMSGSTTGAHEESFDENWYNFNSIAAARGLLQVYTDLAPAAQETLEKMQSLMSTLPQVTIEQSSNNLSPLIPSANCTLNAMTQFAMSAEAMTTRVNETLGVLTPAVIETLGVLTPAVIELILIMKIVLGFLAALSALCILRETRRFCRRWNNRKSGAMSTRSRSITGGDLSRSLLDERSQGGLTLH